MPIQVLMPALSPTMTEGNLAKWLKKEGDKIKSGQVIAEIETDKATMEVEAVDEGILGKILIPAGTNNVKVNELIAVILEEGEDKSALDNFSSNNNSSAKPVEPVKATETKESKPKDIIDIKTVAADQRIKASPLAKRIADEKNINLANVSGTGPHGRIVRADLENVSSAKVMTQQNICYSNSEPSYIPNNNIRKIIAKRLVESKQTIPHFYLNISCNIDKLLAMRKEINGALDDSSKISVNDMVIKASAKALRKVPEANSSWTEEHIIRYNTVDISVAVAIDGGLITPIIKNADLKSVVDISAEMKDLASRARQNKLKPEEFQGGNFSISNLGMYGIKNFNAIINPPQSCIIAVGAGEERVIAKNGAMQIANMVDITLSCDHRVVDGAVGANFLKELKFFIENPVMMMV